jgi:hypothetical protein
LALSGVKRFSHVSSWWTSEGALPSALRVEPGHHRKFHAESPGQFFFHYHPILGDIEQFTVELTVSRKADDEDFSR